MFVDFVYSEYDKDSCDELVKAIEISNNLKAQRLTTNIGCSNIFDFSQNVNPSPLTKREVKPMMASCSADFKYNPDGSWEISTRIDFADNEPNNENSESCDESLSNQETDETDLQDQG